MARRLRWTSRADDIFTEILEFYCKRNKFNTYSQKLNNDINEILKLLVKYPFWELKRIPRIFAYS